MRLRQTRQLSSAVRAVNNVLSAAIANRARRLRHAPSGKLHAAETFVNSDCLIVVSFAEIEAPSVGESCVALYFQVGNKLIPDFRGKISQFTRLIIQKSLNMRGSTVFLSLF